MLWPQDFLIDRIGITVRTAGASSVTRLGVYRILPVGTDFAELVFDAGTVDSSTTGNKEITISEALSPGFYMFVAPTQGGTPPQLRANSHTLGPLGPTMMGTTSFDTSGGNNGQRPYNYSSITGALPATLANPGTASNGAIIVGVRAA